MSHWVIISSAQWIDDTAVYTAHESLVRLSACYLCRTSLPVLGYALTASQAAKALHAVALQPSVLTQSSVTLSFFRAQNVTVVKLVSNLKRK